ncbi:hypothetical protein PVAP13_3NG088359 [Panicum virgatum]|uniref:Uncharacterized protein n=1 Tax=Panicum virgatum TaxID=38727 RepID=A0A8T0U4P0_PANVG|nr:hypothetical protein PVAP13_3NG088359 [Panicum virgatum]
MMCSYPSNGLSSLDHPAHHTSTPPCPFRASRTRLATQVRSPPALIFPHTEKKEHSPPRIAPSHRRLPASLPPRAPSHRRLPVPLPSPPLPSPPAGSRTGMAASCSAPARRAASDIPGGALTPAAGERPRPRPVPDNARGRRRRRRPQHPPDGSRGGLSGAASRRWISEAVAGRLVERGRGRGRPLGAARAVRRWIWGQQLCFYGST